jgi:hypothetical protein
MILNLLSIMGRKPYPHGRQQGSGGSRLLQLLNNERTRKMYALGETWKKIPELLFELRFYIYYLHVPLLSDQARRAEGFPSVQSAGSSAAGFPTSV